MNRWKVKFEEIADQLNCEQGILLSIKNKNLTKRTRLFTNKRYEFGPNKISIEYIKNNICQYALGVKKFLIDVVNGDAHFSCGKFSVINNDGTNGKRRELCKPIYYPDQCASWAILRIMEPFFIN